MSEPTSPPSFSKVVACPACKGKSQYMPSNPYRPFCSERCKNIDLGIWASESFRMPVDGADENDFPAS